jgi:hypothetical protein
VVVEVWWIFCRASPKHCVEEEKEEERGAARVWG